MFLLFHGSGGGSFFSNIAINNTGESFSFVDLSVFRKSSKIGFVENSSAKHVGQIFQENTTKMEHVYGTTYGHSELLGFDMLTTIYSPSQRMVQ